MKWEIKWYGRVVVYVVSSLVLSAALFGAVSAVDDVSIGQTFQSNDQLAVGSLVSLDDGSKIRASNTDTVSQLVGVVTDSALLELSAKNDGYTVATSGTVTALVSDINGTINKGDPITASPVAGVGMKALTSTRVIGSAQVSFSESDQKTTREVKLSNGKTRMITIASVPVQVNISYLEIDDKQSFLPTFLQQIANDVAGRSVSPLRVIVAMLVLLVGLGAAAVILSASVRSSIVSIGRNPLSAKAVHRSLFEAGGIGVGILIVMLIAVYLVLIL